MRSVFKIHNAIIKKTKTLEKLRVGEIGETPRDQNKKVPSVSSRSESLSGM